MNTISAKEMHSLYFKDKYTNFESMVCAFNVHKRKDKEGIYKNKKYMVQASYSRYNFDDLSEYLKFDEEKHNTICYAKQLIIDIEALAKEYAPFVTQTKISNIVGIPNQYMNTLDLSYEASLKVIEKVENKIKSLSIESIRDLKQNFNKMIA